MAKKKYKSPSKNAQSQKYWINIKASQERIAYIVAQNQKFDKWAKEHEYRKYREDQ